MNKPAPLGFFAQMAALDAARSPFVLATVVDTGGSTPRLAGAQMLVTSAERWGTIGGGAFEHSVLAEARRLLENPAAASTMYSVHLVRDLAMCCGGKMSVFLNKQTPEPRLRIYGAGHIGTELAFLAQRAGFVVTCVDSRDTWADAERFPPEVSVLDDEPDDHLRRRPPDKDEYVVICTHAHDLDETLVRKALESQAHYIGMVGSHGKWGRFKKRFEARGIDETTLERVRCPVGLEIAAETPSEIAVSIVAELVAVRRRIHSDVE